MINLRPLIEQRIREQVPSLKEIAGASDLQSLLAGRLADAGCYIIPESDRASENSRVNAVAQRLVEQYSLIFIVRNLRDPRGADAADVCHALRLDALAALVGWIPDPACEAFEKVSGRLISFANGFYIWQDTYRTAQYIHS